MMVTPETLDAFQQMWGRFPEPVMLVHKSRTILAVNELAKKLGIASGIKCFSRNKEEPGITDHCRRCQADVALRTGEAVMDKEIVEGVELFWVPLKGVPDVYLHFGIGSAERIARLSQRSETRQGPDAPA